MLLRWRAHTRQHCPCYAEKQIAPCFCFSPLLFSPLLAVIGLVSQAPSIIESVMTLITEIEAGYAKAKAAGGDPIVVFEDILQAIVANKGAIATAALGHEPVVSTNGTVK